MWGLLHFNEQQEVARGFGEGMGLFVTSSLVILRQKISLIIEIIIFVFSYCSETRAGLEDLHLNDQRR